MALYLTEQEVTALLDMPTALDAVETALREHGNGTATNRPRQRVRAAAGILHAMVGGITTIGAMGLKAYTTFRPAGARFLVLLYDAATGDLLSLMQADRLGQMRTGAASGIATKYMARPNATTVGLFGAGWQAQSQVEAICQVRPIREVRVVGRDPERRDAFCREMSARLGVEVRPARSAEEAVCGVDVVVTATNARQPVFDGEWLEPGVHVNAMGSNDLSRREIDVETVRRSDLIAVDSIEQARLESGDLAPAVEQRVIAWEGLAEIGAIVAGRVPGRPKPDAITLFESHGLAIEDVATAARVYARARERRIGTELPL
ncbi:MAG: ornithine cyclodeaminase family protein [Chloroflexi bacterium]|nr:ornithine cyclodeaminase family protein [Chloroflexota bacterium]